MLSASTRELPLSARERDSWGALMSKTYTLPYTLKAPSEETEHMFLAEVPVLPGCRAWGETAEEALRSLDGVAADFIASYREHGDELPQPIAAADELVIAV